MVSRHILGHILKRQFDTRLRRAQPTAIIVYDTQDNLPQKTMIAREKGVLVAVVDIQSGTWKMAREIFEFLQKEITSKRKTVNEINIKAIQEVATDIGALVKYTSDIRGKTAKIQKETMKIDSKPTGLERNKDRS